MKKLLAATLLAASFATPALSADMAVKAPPMAVSPAYDWSGFYFGVGAGGEWGRFHRNYPNVVAPLANDYTTNFSRANYAGIVGAQKQFGAWVLGIEGAWDNNVNSINSGVTGYAPAGSNFSSKIRDTVTLGGRVGYAGWNNWLVYGSGGAAWASLVAEAANAGAPVATIFNGSGRVTGWYAGAGVDYMLYKGTGVDAILGLEYQHIDLTGGNTNAFFGVGSVNNYSTDAKEDLVRARLTFKFNPWAGTTTPVVAKY